MIPTPMPNDRPAEVERAQAWLTENESSLIQHLRELLTIPSVESEPAEGAPFGIECRRALDYVLNLGSAWGMTTKNVDGFAGHAEFGNGEPMVMSLGHLDVVPIGSGWKHDPWGAQIDGDYIYARGTSDDKGPTMAAFYAARALKETGANLPARIRIVFGCDEESGFKCVERYFQTEEAPDFGIAPDSGWPLYHAEKGIANIVVSAPLPAGNLNLISLEAGSRPNIVPDEATAVLQCSPSTAAHAQQIADSYWDKNLKIELSGDTIRLTAFGKSAHGSTPFLGDSAATRALRFALALAGPDQAKQFTDLLMLTHPSGAGVGIEGQDEISRDLTANVGIVQTQQGRLQFTINVRYPVAWKGEELRRRAENFLQAERPDYRIEQFDDSPPLFFPTNQEPVLSLMNVYEIEAGDGKQPGVMGGGTYARAVPNTVSVGTGWEGDGPAHEPDERIHISHPLKMAKIYAHMLYALAHAAAKK